MRKEKTINEELLKYIVKRWTGSEVEDALADKDALEAIIGVFYENDLIQAGAKLRAWRKEAIEERKALEELSDEDGNLE